MRGLEDTPQAILRFGQDAGHRVYRAWDGFIAFAARDNVLEVALGLIIAQGFTSVVNSFVSDIVLPLVSLLPFINRNMDAKFWVLSKGPHYKQMGGYNTLDQARADGALVLAYGVFLETVMNFLGLSLTLYTLAQVFAEVSNGLMWSPLITGQAIGAERVGHNGGRMLRVGPVASMIRSDNSKPFVQQREMREKAIMQRAAMSNFSAID
ncbi:large-conductance mechanosensitive channel [Aspergillus egyptiacus]|nr:large-conductance mechanosensitive channel [Aspergillus egyptiacus]